MFTSIQALITALVPWYTQGVPNDRLTGQQTPRPWYIQALGYTKNLLFTNLNTVTDRSALNTQIGVITDQDLNTKQGVANLKVELHTLYGFQKCVTARYKTRLQLYRDDLSNKGYRHLQNTSVSFDNLTILKNNCN